MTTGRTTGGVAQRLTPGPLRRPAELAETAATAAIGWGARPIRETAMPANALAATALVANRLTAIELTTSGLTATENPIAITPISIRRAGLSRICPRRICLRRIGFSRKDIGLTGTNQIMLRWIAIGLIELTPGRPGDFWTRRAAMAKTDLAVTSLGKRPLGVGLGGRQGDRGAGMIPIPGVTFERRGPLHRSERLLGNSWA